ncbi:MAG: hypothetical protein RIS76_2299 [Verrucomicrobiota bacterium]
MRNGWDGGRVQRQPKTCRRRSRNTHRGDSGTGLLSVRGCLRQRLWRGKPGLGVSSVLDGCWRGGDSGTGLLSVRGCLRQRLWRGKPGLGVCRALDGCWRGRWRHERGRKSESRHLVSYGVGAGGGIGDMAGLSGPGPPASVLAGTPKKKPAAGTSRPPAWSFREGCVQRTGTTSTPLTAKMQVTSAALARTNSSRSMRLPASGPVDRSRSV